MDPQGLIAVCFSDLAGQVRAHGIPRSSLQDVYVRGLPWPAQRAVLTAFGEAVDTPWDVPGELRLHPDRKTEIAIDFGDAASAESFVLACVQNGDQKGWGGCTRTFLQATLDVLKNEFGLDLTCNYEHQFSLDGALSTRASAMSLNALRRERQFAGTLASVLDKTGVTLVRFGAGMGERQFTATTQSKGGIYAADSAIIFRQLARATADQLNQHCSFAPQSSPSTTAVQNGLVLGIDLFDDGDQVTYDSGASDGVSATLGSFVAGILRHLPALSALTRPSIIPLRDSNFDSGGVSPVLINPALKTAADTRDYSFAFTAADATACPYLQLGVVVGAGILGLREGLRLADGMHNRPALPDDLAGALERLGADQVFRSVFPAGLLDTYGEVKKAELVTAARMSPAELNAWCQDIY